MKWTLPYTTTPHSVSGACITEIENSSRVDFRGLNFFGKRFFTCSGKISFLMLLLISVSQLIFSQSCPSSGTTTISTNPNTYYPGTTPSVSAGATSITLGAAGAGINFGTTPIAAGDLVLIIQMQGAQIISTNTSTYGGNQSGIASGFTNVNLLAGYMEFAVATSAVPLTGGILTLSSGVVNSYAYAAYGATGQYTYQIIRVPTYYNIILSGTITTAQWNGSTGGVTVINAVNQLNLNNALVSAIGMGFRGGGGVNYTGLAGLRKTDYVTLSTQTANGSKGEGIAGTPRFINTFFGGVYAVLDNGVANEGYPNGSFGRGAPGNAGGGATDSDPAANDQNAGGGGGGNGNIGGFGGNGWSSFGATGGRGGMSFTNQTSPFPAYYSPSRLIMGGGGGAGTINNATGIPANGPAASGVSGGGIIILNATSVTGTGTVDASGASGSNSAAISPQIDGAGGGGAGGSVLINANSGLAGITANAIGGNGGSNFPGINYGATGHGPGGSGAGGVIFSSAALNPASSVLGGQPGYSYATGLTSHYGADSSYHNGVLTQTFPSSQLPPNMTICQISVLATSLLDFRATNVSQNTVMVSWTTANQVNASYFVVEKSSDGTNYNAVGQVTASHSAEETHAYNLTDYISGPSESVVYYRLEMVGSDGNISYSRIVPIKLGGGDAKISIYPNPASDYAVLNLYSGTQTTATMKLIDNSGRLITTRLFTLNNGNNSLLIDHLASLSKGIYIIQVFYGNTQYNEKLLKN